MAPIDSRTRATIVVIVVLLLGIVTIVTIGYAVITLIPGPPLGR